MKKLLLAFILIICSSMCFACSCGNEPTIKFRYQQISVNIGNTYTIEKDDITIVGSDSEYTLTIEDETIASIENNVISPIAKGSTVLKISLVDEDVSIEVPLVVTHKIYATNASIEKSYVQINIGENKVAYNNITLNEGCNEKPIVSYDSRVVNYDYTTGKITAMGEGFTTVVVLWGSCNVSFNVNVVDIVYTRKIEIENHNVFVGVEGKLSYLVFPDTANTFEFVSDSENVILQKDGTYETLSEGLVEIQINYLVSKDVKSTQTIFMNVISRPTELDTTITNINGQSANNYLVGSKYRLQIPYYEWIENADIILSQNAKIYEKIVDNNVINVYFQFVESGIQELSITIALDKYNEYTQSNSCEVSDLSSLEIRATWSIYIQEPHYNGKYVVYKSSESGVINYLYFRLILNGNNISENYSIYVNFGGERQKCFDSSTDGVKFKFSPTEIGEYILEFEINGIICKACSVMVLSYE